jgi:hypothetical protein
MLRVSFADTKGVRGIKMNEPVGADIFSECKAIIYKSVRNITVHFPALSYSLVSQAKVSC